MSLLFEMIKAMLLVLILGVNLLRAAARLFGYLLLLAVLSDVSFDTVFIKELFYSLVLR